MAREGNDFADLMRRVRLQAEGAVHELIEHYGSHILRVVRRRLNKELRSKFDSDDFVQAVWASFFALPLDEYCFERSAALAAFLAQIANHKVIEVVRQRLKSAKYNVKRERPLDEAYLPAAHPAGGEPDPADVAIAREEWDRLLGGRPFHHQQILTALRDGYTQREAAKVLGVSEKTVTRLLNKARPQDET